MSKYGSSSAVFLVGGYNFLSAKLQSLSQKIESLTEQTAGLGDNFEAHTPIGKSRTTITQAGAFFDTATAGLHAAMAAGTPTTPQATPRVTCFGCMGQIVGAVYYGVVGLFTSAYEVLVEDSKLTKANVTHLIAGALERGQIVQPLATKTANWNTKTLGTVVDYTTDASQVPVAITSNSIAAASVVTTPIPHGLTSNDIILISGVVTSSPTINGERVVTVLSPTTFSVPVTVTVAGTGGSFVRSNSSNGAAGYQQVPAFSGFTGFVGKLRDSADDTTYADLLSFANVTAAQNAQRVTVAGVVDRYMSLDGAVTGTGSIDTFAGVSRL
jgi:hypothetical protein